MSAYAQAIKRDSHGHVLALLVPDETTIAMLDNKLRTPFTTIEGSQQDEPKLVAQWLDRHPEDGLILIDLPGHATGKLTRLLDRLSPKQPLSDGILLTLQQANIAHLVARYDLPQGRRYALVESARAPALAGIHKRVAPAS